MAGKAIRIVNRGQTGVDRAALAWAIRRGVPYKGWCPKGTAGRGRNDLPARNSVRNEPYLNVRQARL